MNLCSQRSLRWPAYAFRPLSKGSAMIAVFLSFWGTTHAAEGLRVYITVDGEGIGGVTTPRQDLPDGNEFSLYRKIATAEVNAAIEGAIASGASKISVEDGHS